MKTRQSAKAKKLPPKVFAQMVQALGYDAFHTTVKAVVQVALLPQCKKLNPNHKAIIKLWLKS